MRQHLEIRTSSSVLPSFHPPFHSPCALPRFIPLLRGISITRIPAARRLPIALTATRICTAAAIRTRRRRRTTRNRHGHRLCIHVRIALLLIQTAVRIGVKRTRGVLADGVQLRPQVTDGTRRAAAEAEVRLEDAAHGGGVGVAHAEADGCGADLADEVADLVGVEGHVFLHAGHTGVAAVGGEASAGAAEEDAEELVEVRQKEAGVES
jgi:hypothetical protein